jgi:hypothetical protein
MFSMLIGARASEKLVKSQLCRAPRKDELLGTKNKHSVFIAEYCARNGIDPHCRKLPSGFYKPFWIEAYGETSAASFGEDTSKKKMYWLRRLRAWQCGQTSDATRLRVLGQVENSTSMRRRSTGQQGRPVKCSDIEEELIRWFAVIRRRGVRVSPGAFLRQAQTIRLECIRIALKHEFKVAFPECDSGWSRRVRARHAISLRRPNLRWKVPKAVLFERMGITWSNVYKVRLIIWLLFGYDPEMDSFDQKPFHHDEAGSKDRRTLAFRGSGTVSLKENCANTRDRWTANTLCQSDFAETRRIPFAELMFKGGDRVNKDLQAVADELRACGHSDLSITTSDSASYRLEHVLEYLERMLLPWGEGRRWRILMCDAYKAHLDASIKRLAWSRGYVVVYQGGGCTAVGQVNDTDLHEHLSRQYQNVEMQGAIDESALVSCPHRTREVCAGDFCTVWWQEDMHALAASGFKKRGLTNALDGSEDGLLRGPARQIFEDIGMAHRRALIQADMQDGLAGDELRMTYKDVYRLLQEFPHRGVLDALHEGQEDSLNDDERPYSDVEDESAASVSGAPAKEGAPKDARACGEAVLGTLPEEVAGKHSAAALACASQHMRTVAIVDQMLQNSSQLGNQHVQITLERARETALRRARECEKKDPALGKCLRDFFEDRRMKEERARKWLDRLKKEKKTCDAAREAADEAKASLKRQRHAFAAEHAERRREEEELTALKFISPQMLGQGLANGGTKEHEVERKRYMERVKAKFPPLEAQNRNNWTQFVERFDEMNRRVVGFEGKAYGSYFHNEMQYLVRERAKGNVHALDVWMGTHLDKNPAIFAGYKPV